MQKVLKVWHMAQFSTEKLTLGLNRSCSLFSAEVWSRFKVCTVFETIPEERCFPTLQDALAQSKQIITLQDTLSHSKQVIKNEDLECEQEQ
jgi:hypothetical protein